MLIVDQNSAGIYFTGGNGLGGTAEADLGTLTHRADAIQGTLQLYNANGTMWLDINDSLGGFGNNGHTEVTVSPEEVQWPGAIVVYDLAQVTQLDLSLNRDQYAEQNASVTISIPDDKKLYFRNLVAFNVNTNGTVTIKALAKTPKGSLYVNGDGRLETDLGDRRTSPRWSAAFRGDKHRVLHLTDANPRDVAGTTSRTPDADDYYRITGLTPGTISYKMFGFGFVTVDTPTASGARLLRR